MEMFGAVWLAWNALHAFILGIGFAMDALPPTPSPETIPDPPAAVATLDAADLPIDEDW